MNKNITYIGIVVSNFLSKEILKKKIKDRNIKFIFNTTNKKLNETSILDQFKDCEIIISGTEKYSKNLLSNFKKLRHIIRIGVGTENIDLKFLDLNNISIHTTDGLLANSVAELIVYHILFLSRNLFNIYKEKEPIWSRSYGNLINKKKIGLVGYGRIGSKLAEILQSFDPEKILIFDNNLNKKNYFPKKFQIIKSLNLIFKNADIVSINLPLNKYTKSIINSSLLNKAKKNLILINTSRADIINKKDLLEFLKKNNEAKVGFDVFYDEPSYKPFLGLKNVSYSSHIGSYTFESRLTMELEAINMISFLIK